jgi:hypothetical protein
MTREKLEALAAALQGEYQQAQQNEAAARVARLRLEGALALVQQLLQEEPPAGPVLNEGESNHA